MLFRSPTHVMLNVKLTNEAASTWTNFKLGKWKEGDKQVSWFTLKFDNAREPTAVQVDISGTGDFDEFLAALPDNEARYGVFNLKYKKGDGDREKCALLVWAPDASPVKARMTIAANKDCTKGQLDGVAIEFQAAKKSEVVHTEWIDKASSTLK